MKASVPFILAALLISPAGAQPRPSTERLTCAEAAGLVTAHGAIVLSTGPITYDRFVSHAGHCQRGEMAQPSWVPTRDSARCSIGAVCREKPPRF